MFAVALIAATALLMPARRANAQTARPGILEGLDVDEAPAYGDFPSRRTFLLTAGAPSVP